MAVKPERAPSLASNQSGQAVVEYILILALVVSLYVTLNSWASRFGLARKLVTPISKDFAKIYQYGDPKAAGFEDETRKRHPRISGCEGCFRLFINPEVK